MPLLKLEDVVVDYGSIHALKGINMELEPGEVVTMIGSNGAGKSTTMKAIMGMVKCKSGHIWYDGKDITNQDTQHMVQSGIILSPEGRQVFPRYSVKDNLILGAYVRPREEIAESLEQVYALLPKLKQRSGQLAGSLSGGEQQMRAVARALMSSPRLLLLDEPGLGLAPLIVQEIFSKIKLINKEDKVTVFVVEQNARLALKSSDDGYVMENGVIVLHDEAQALLKNQKVRAAYLGE